MTLITIFLFVFRLLPAPCVGMIYIQKVEPINYYDPLVRAVVWTESRGNNNAYNAKEEARGAFQIRPCRIQHYNRLTGVNYTLQDCFDYNVGRKVFLYFAQGKTYEKAAKGWNGSGPMTIDYWKRVKTQL